VKRFMLDTNAVSYLVHKRSARLQNRLEQLSGEDRVCISVVTEAEMRYGVALKPDAQRLAYTVEIVLSGLEILPWTSEAAKAYATLRAENKLRGLAAGNLDLLIAAHAIAVGAVLVTSDGAISRLVGGLVTVNWADDLRPN
jgi:tRNA(fMet)-specific endonuclease VapC